MSDLSTEFLSIDGLARGLGCKPNRLKFLYRAGVFGLWPELVTYTEFEGSEHQELELIEVVGAEMHAVKFHRDLLQQPSLFMIVLNAVEVTSFGPGWESSRDPKMKLAGVIEPERLKLVAPGRKVPAVMKRITRIPSRPISVSPPRVRGPRAGRAVARATGR